MNCSIQTPAGNVRFGQAALTLGAMGDAVPSREFLSATFDNV